jgi:dimeric dUTPase (all-alpha-NTP-PPase superfamily)
MNQFLKVYEENKILDEIFHNLYDNFNQDTIEKNIVELLVEIGELANETRCFKYWSNKGSSEKDVVLDEYADCFLMTLYFCNMTDIDLNESFSEVTNDDVVAQFKELYVIVAKLDYSLNKDIIKLILSNLVNLGRLLGFNDEDITNGCIKKIERNKKRFETGF